MKSNILDDIAKYILVEKMKIDDIYLVDIRKVVDVSSLNNEVLFPLDFKDMEDQFENQKKVAKVSKSYSSLVSFPYLGSVRQTTTLGSLEGNYRKFHSYALSKFHGLTEGKWRWDICATVRCFLR